MVNGQIVFENDQDAEKYNAFVNSAQGYVTEQEQIKKAAVDATKGGFERMKEGL